MRRKLGRKLFGTSLNSKRDKKLSNPSNYDSEMRFRLNLWISRADNEWIGAGCVSGGIFLDRNAAALDSFIDFPRQSFGLISPRRNLQRHRLFISTTLFCQWSNSISMQNTSLHPHSLFPQAKPHFLCLCNREKPFLSLFRIHNFDGRNRLWNKNYIFLSFVSLYQFASRHKPLPTWKT